MLEAHAALHAERSAVFGKGSYSALGSVERAFERLDGLPQFDEFLRRVGQLLDSFRCGRTFGAFLLHRHFVPGPGQIPLETPMQWTIITGPREPPRCRVSRRGTPSLADAVRVSPAPVRTVRRVTQAVLFGP